MRATLSAEGSYGINADTSAIRFELFQPRLGNNLENYTASGSALSCAIQSA